MPSYPQTQRAVKQADSVEHSVFCYCYRDASNYKSWGKLLLAGQASSSDQERLINAFDAGEFFIAEQLNIPPLYEELWVLSGGPTTDDHVWHTFYKLRLATTDESRLPVFDTVENLVSKAKAVNCWDETLSPHWAL